VLDPALIGHAPLSPGTCALCRTHEGPFIDTLVNAIEGRVYVCAKTCGNQIAVLLGYTSPEDAYLLRLQIEELTAEGLRLNAELGRERENKTVALADVLDYVEARATRSEPVTKSAA
jgi:hypothetical protein